jgi:hypothetical protein
MNAPAQLALSRDLIDHHCWLASNSGYWPRLVAAKQKIFHAPFLVHTVKPIGQRISAMGPRGSAWLRKRIFRELA